MPFYFLLALLNSIAFIAGRFQLFFLFWIFLLLAFSITLIRIRSIDCDNYSGTSLSILSAAVVYLLFSGAGMTWDVASFEFPKYYDLLAGTKGPYWTYALLPPVFYGSSLSLGLLGIATIYTYSLALFSLSFCELIHAGNGKNRLTKITILSILLITLFNGIFHIGKGDLLAASFLNIATTCAVSLCISKKSRAKNNNLFLCETDPRESLAILIIYAMLSFLSKTGTALLAVPLILISIIGFFMRLRSLGQTIFLSRNLKLLFAATFLSLIASLFIYFYEFYVHGLPGAVDLAIAEAGKNHSLIFSMSKFSDKLIRPGSLLMGEKLLSSLLIIFTSILVVIFGLVRKMRYSHCGLPEKILIGCLASTFVISIVSMPFAALHPLGFGIGYSSENLRLIAQPSLALIILSLA